MVILRNKEKSSQTEENLENIIFNIEYCIEEIENSDKNTNGNSNKNSNKNSKYKLDDFWNLFLELETTSHNYVEDYKKETSGLKLENYNFPKKLQNLKKELIRFLCVKKEDNIVCGISISSFIHLINCICCFVLCNFPRKFIPTKL
jgi:hypothetical protein